MLRLFISQGKHLRDIVKKSLHLVWGNILLLLRKFTVLFSTRGGVVGNKLCKEATKVHIVGVHKCP